MIQHAKQQNNGGKGETRTQGLLLDDFWVLKRSVDVDGADFLVQLPASSIEELRNRHAEAFGVVQAKYFEGRNQVRISRACVESESSPRSNFFAILHTDNSEREKIYYFFSAEQIRDFFNLSKCGEYYSFRLTKARDYAQFKNVPSIDIRRAIYEGIIRSGTTNASTVVDLHYSLDGASRESSADSYTYMLRAVEEVNIVLVNMTGMKPELAKTLEPRRDIFQYAGNFSWGYVGTGPLFLCASILGHHVVRRRPTQQERDRLLRNLVCEIPRKFSPGLKFEITSEMIEQALQDTTRSYVNYIDEFKKEFGELSRSRLPTEMAKQVGSRFTEVLHLSDVVYIYKNPHEEVVRVDRASPATSEESDVWLAPDSIRKFVTAAAIYAGQPLNFSVPVLTAQLPEKEFGGYWLESTVPPASDGIGFHIRKVVD